VLIIRTRKFLFGRDQAVAPGVVRRIMRELKELDKNPPEGIRIQTNEEDLLDVTGIIEGPGE
jgi:ubiquitin-conjugating enzyme E2 S